MKILKFCAAVFSVFCMFCIAQQLSFRFFVCFFVCFVSSLIHNMSFREYKSFLKKKKPTGDIITDCNVLDNQINYLYDRDRLRGRQSSTNPLCRMLSHTRWSLTAGFSNESINWLIQCPCILFKIIQKSCLKNVCCLFFCIGHLLQIVWLWEGTKIQTWKLMDSSRFSCILSTLLYTIISKRLFFLILMAEVFLLHEIPFYHPLKL